MSERLETLVSLLNVGWQVKLWVMFSHRHYSQGDSLYMDILGMPAPYLSEKPC